MKSLSVIFLTLFLVCHQIHASSIKAKHMHPPPSHGDANSRVKRDEQIFHGDGVESTSNFWRAEAQKKLRQQLHRKLNQNTAKNLIMFLGDGMSISTIAAARIYFGQKLGFTGEESKLSFEEFPFTGFSKVSFYLIVRAF